VHVQESLENSEARRPERENLLIIFKKEGSFNKNQKNMVVIDHTRQV
jgi:hypothetical protein